MRWWRHHPHRVSTPSLARDWRKRLPALRWSSMSRMRPLGRTTQSWRFSLLVLLLPLPLDIKFPLFAPYFRRAFPLELVPVNRQLVLDGDLVIHELPHGGERERTVLQLQILEFRLLLVRPAHRPGEFVPVLLDRQGGRPLLVADLVLALPRPDRVYLVCRAREAADPEYQRHCEDRFHDRLR